ILDSAYADFVPGAFPSPEVARAEVQALKAGEKYYTRVRNSARERVVFMALSRAASGYTVSIEQSEPPLLAVVRIVQVTLVLGMIMALLMALVGSWIAADKVTKPLQAIRRSAQQITVGELDEPIQVDTRAAEIQDLANNLDRMSDSFREKIDELERLTRLQSEFIGNVSHEVRNPIFAISGYLEALGSPKLDDERRKRYAEKGLFNLQRLASLFNDLIEIARLEYQEDIITARVFDLAELIEEAAEMLRPKAEEKGLHLIVTNPPTMVRADRNRIRQVFVNLIDNAITYSDEGTIRCRLRRRLDKIRVEVVDTGRGIGEAHLERIFERFYRVDTGRSRKSGGTGLGLSIVKQILQAHGEPIHVESTLGRGSRFWFDLPYVEETEEVEATS
ncbi:MAG: HAMP domain-containing protein, partial [Bacteroidetes bacterium]|nr:HAMP domain-containing protein [Bacteroidota bacterium]